jgi:hypothetical protein
VPPRLGFREALLVKPADGGQSQRKAEHRHCITKAGASGICFRAARSNSCGLWSKYVRHTVRCVSMTPKKRSSFWINEAEADGLKAEDGISESEQIRQAVRDWLEKEGRQKSGPQACWKAQAALMMLLIVLLEPPGLVAARSLVSSPLHEPWSAAGTTAGGRSAVSFSDEERAELIAALSRTADMVPH